MKKIIFGITSLTMGGAERVLVDLCNHFCEDYEITIFSLYGEGEFEKELNSKIVVKHFYETSFLHTPKRKRKWLSFQLQIPFLRKQIYNRYIHGYDTEIAFLEGPITWLFSESSNAFKVAWIHNDITSVFGNGLLAKRKEKVNKKIYQAYQKCIFVSKDNLEKFQNTIPYHGSMEVIYNYINEKKVREKAEEYKVELNKNTKNIVVVSRLTEQKAIERLIKVHERLIKEKKYHSIYVVGTGPLEESLKEKLKNLYLEDSFHLVGGKTNPYPYIKAADYFGLFSYYEGYPMVLLEARILNAKIIITDTSAREVLTNYKKKLILENSEEGIYQGLCKVLKGKSFSKKEEIFSNEQIEMQVKRVLEGEL